MFSCHFTEERTKTTFTLTSRYNPESGELDLSDKTGMLMVSMKSKLFTKEFIQSVTLFSQANLQRMAFTVVDIPYVLNILAGDVTLEEVKNRVDNLIKIRREIVAKVEKVVRSCNADSSYVSWSQIQLETPNVFRQEVYVSSRTNSEFRNRIFELVESSIPPEAINTSIENFALFIMSELPCLLYLYSGLRGDIVDFYPKSNPAVIWDILEGKYRESMPYISSAADENKKFIFASLDE